MTRAVIYARYSSTGQREESIEGQLRDCNKYAQQNGMKVVAEYCDKALSGTNDRRPQFQKMIADALQDKFDAVICWKCDRFARNRTVASVYREQLKQHNVSLHYAMERIPDEPVGIMMEALLEGYAEFYSANLSQNVKRGNYDSALKHQTLGVTVYGYSEDKDKHYVINEDEARWVRFIFAEIIKGSSIGSICETLKKHEVRTCKGNYFNHNYIHRIISQQKYKGTYTYLNLIKDEDAIPAIVSKEDWAVANEAIKHTPHSYRHRDDRTENFILTGKIICGHCGQNIIGDSVRKYNDKVFSYYTCTGKKIKKICDRKSVSQKWLEDIVLKAIWEQISTDEAIEKLVDTAYQLQLARRKNSPVASIEKEISDVKRRKDNLVRAIENGAEGIEYRLKELNAELERLQTEKTAAEYETGVFFDRETLMEYACSFYNLGYPTSQKMKEKMVDAFLHKAVLYKDHLDIYFDCKDMIKTVILDGSDNDTLAPPAGIEPTTDP